MFFGGELASCCSSFVTYLNLQSKTYKSRPIIETVLILLYSNKFRKKYFRRKCLKEPRELSEMLESIPKNIDAEEFIKEWSHKKEERGDLIHSKILLGDS